MKLSIKMLTLCLFALLTFSCASQTFEDFKSGIITEADEADTPAERALILRDWTQEIRRLNHASIHWDDETRRLNLLAREIDANGIGIPLTDNEILDRAEHLAERQQHYATLWGMPIPA